MVSSPTFKKISNDEAWAKLNSIESLCRETNGKVKLHHRWLYALSTIVLLILGAIVKAGVK